MPMRKAKRRGFAQHPNIEDGETVRAEEERKGAGAGGVKKLVVIEHKGGRRPRITIEGSDGKVLDFHYLPAWARIEVTHGQKIEPGKVLARKPRWRSRGRDIIGGFPRVNEIFEARKPKDPAVLAEISGFVELASDKRPGKLTVIIKKEDVIGVRREHYVHDYQELMVHSGDFVEAGEALVRGPLIPHDILRIKGEESLCQHLLDELQYIYRQNGVKIDDKHFEVILAQLLGWVKVEDAGDSGMRPGEVIGKSRLRHVNDLLTQRLRVDYPGGTPYHKGDVVLKSELQAANAAAEAAGIDPAHGSQPRPPRGKTLLCGITKASLLRHEQGSFLSAAARFEIKYALTSAALAGSVDPLEGRRENLIVGRPIPAGSGFRERAHSTSARQESASAIGRCFGR
jgi:DNA-directed RNA polymerase subunit beta'